MRQNRDIARANSTQSLRIRNLENETSRLLAENLGLREQIIQLQNELENGKAQRIADNTGAIKSQLESKLLEIGALITSLGDGSTAPKKSPRQGKIIRASPGKSAEQRNRKSMCTLSEAVAGQEGRLPAILENKSYPRRTLEYVHHLAVLIVSKLIPYRSQELVNPISEVALDSTDSPEIGPPPVSQFVDEDPVKIDLPTRLKTDTHEDLASLDPALSVNLEQRRKRRDSSSSAESRRSSKVEPTPATKENMAPLKTGAKRKLSVRDDEEHETATKPAESSSDEFKFTRVVSEDRAKSKPVSQERPGSKVARELAVARGAPREKSSATAAPTSRKVLAPKSVNDSPKKGTKAPVLDEAKAAKADILKANATREQPRERRQEPVSIKPSPSDAPIQTVEVQPEPETPAGPDLFSPHSSQPSTARAESRDTPPPPDLGPGTEGQRPSRRARAAVSYAEPSLRDKMRRPGKELVDAVVPGTKPYRAGTIKVEDEDPATSIRIKPEPEADDAWKSMPIASSATVENSPLSGKILVPEALPSSITTYRKRRESILTENDLPRTSSAISVAALLAGNRRAKTEVHGQSLDNENASSKASVSHDIYDFKGSSPIPPAEAAVKPVKEEKKPVSRFSRRYSSIPRDIPPVYDSESSDPEGSKRSDLSKSCRRQSTLGLRNSSSASTTSSREEDTEKTLKRANSTIGTSDSIAARNDRISARRRSMML